MDESLYFKNGKPRKHPKKIKAVIVDEPVPIVNEDLYGFNNDSKLDWCLNKGMKKEDSGGKPRYDPPLPVSVVNIDETITSNSKGESTCEIYNGDCLELMKDIQDKSVDLIFCDLPYGQISCSWDCCIDLDVFWKEVMRIKKLNTPIFMTTTTKFGVSLINSAPKKCHFRYDIVWVKSAAAGFLSAKKMPMRKHEMIYVFYEKLPFYDLSSHTHKFIKKEEKQEPSYYMKDGKTIYNGGKEMGIFNKGGTAYEPPLPVSVVKEETGGATGKEELCKYDVNKNTYGGGKEGRIKIPKDKKYHEAKYDPPLPVSIIKEECTTVIRTDEGCNGLYGKETGKVMIYDKDGKLRNSEPRYDPPLPVSVVKEEEKKVFKTECKTAYGKATHHSYRDTVYDPPLPTSMLEVKSTRGKHSTEKPVALMEWIFKYYSKEGDTILDPTMGSGSTGVACKNMNRNFIGIEMDKEIYEGAKSRLEL